MGRIIVDIRLIVIIISTRRIVLGTLIVAMQRIVLGILIDTIATVTVLITISIPNIGQGMLGITTTCIVDTTIVTTAPTNSTAIRRPTTLAISSANQWISTPETTTSAERT